MFGFFGPEACGDLSSPAPPALESEVLPLDLREVPAFVLFFRFYINTWGLNHMLLKIPVG